MQNCPKCQSENIYQDGNLWICPSCSFEWTASESSNLETSGAEIQTEDLTIRDSNGIVLSDGDNIIVIKDLKIKGASSQIKSGTKVRNIKLFDAGDGHNIVCKIEGLGTINLKSQFVKKV